MDAVGQDLATHSHVEANSLVATVEGGQLPLQLLGLMARHMVEEPEYKVRTGSLFHPTHLTFPRHHILFTIDKYAGLSTTRTASG